jgi:hypothetical protein
MSREPRDACGEEGGLGDFLRRLIPGVPFAERAEVEETIEIPRPNSGVLRIHNSNGRTRITGEERDEIVITAFKTARAESEAAAQKVLEDIQLVFGETPEALDLDVEVARRWNRKGAANLYIRVPRDMNIWVAAANGRVAVEGIHGHVRARSTNGSASVSNVVGKVEVATTNAKVCCQCICGELSARSSNGKIEIDQHRGAVNASTSNGLIRASLDDIEAGGVQLATSNGKIVLDLPEQVDAEVDIRVDNGVIRNDRKLCGSSRESHGRVVGRLGKGGALIKLRTSNGSVNVH